jgi:hypothetical protein
MATSARPLATTDPVMRANRAKSDNRRARHRSPLREGGGRPLGRLSFVRKVHALIKVLMAKNDIDNLGEEVRKGMIEKARQCHWPTVAPA